MDPKERKYYDGMICSMVSIEHRFNRPNAFELKADVGLFDAEKKPLKKVEVYLEVSMEYGKGNNASKTQWEMTKEPLQSLGFEGEDISNPRLATLVNRPCRICEQITDKGDIRYYFTTKKPEVAIDNANDRLNQMMGQVAGGASQVGGAAAPAGAAAFADPAPAAAAPAAGNPPNPFAGM